METVRTLGPRLAHGWVTITNHGLAVDAEVTNTVKILEAEKRGPPLYVF